MKKFAIIAIVAGSLSGCVGKVQLPHKKLSYADACPGYQDVRCHPDDDPRALIFNLNPPVIENENGTPRYLAFVGRAYRQPYNRGALGRPCNDVAMTPFVDADRDSKSASGTFDYRYKLKSNLSASADVDLVKAAVAAGLPPGAKDNVAAAAKAAFEQAKEREVVTSGQMRVVRLWTTVLDEVRQGNTSRLTACRQFLKDNPDYAIIKAITVFHIGKSGSDASIANQIAVNIKASVTGADSEKLAAINSAIDSKVTEQIQSALEDRYIVWAATWLKPEDI